MLHRDLEISRRCTISAREVVMPVAVVDLKINTWFRRHLAWNVEIDPLAHQGREGRNRIEEGNDGLADRDARCWRGCRCDSQSRIDGESPELPCKLLCLRIEREVNEIENANG